MNFDESFIGTRYQILLHSLNFSSPAAQKVFNISQDGTNNIAPLNSKSPDIQYHDAVDYFDVNSKLHWKNLEFDTGTTNQQVTAKQTGYRKLWISELKAFKKELIKMIADDVSVVNRNSSTTFSPKSESFSDIITIDITDKIKTIEGYTNDLNDFSNTVGFVLNMNSEFDNDVYNGLNKKSKNIKDFVTENQVVEIRAKRDGDSKYYTEYIGFIGTITYEKKHNNVNSLIITTYGLHKLLSSSNIVNRQAIYQMFESGIEITQSGVPVYQDNWNNLNVYEIFKEIMRSVLSLKPFNINSSLESASNNVKKYSVDVADKEQQIKDLNQEIALLQPLYGGVEPVAISSNVEKHANYVKQKEKLTTDEQKLKELEGESQNGTYYKSRQDLTNASNKYTEIFKEVRKTLAKVSFIFDGDSMISIDSFRTSFLTMYLYYLVRVKCSKYGTYKKYFENKPNSILVPTTADSIALIEHGDHKAFNEMVATGFARWYSDMTMPVDVLKSIRDSALFDIYEERHGHIVCRPPKYNDLYVDLPDEPATNSITKTTNIPNIPKGDFAITYDKIIDVNYSRNDLDLLTRCDTKNMWPYLGEVQYIGSNYSDPNLLIKYGLRVNQPSTNPNVGEPRVATLFSALSLYRQNMLTRQIAISVPNDREYFVGNLYYIQFTDDVNDEYVGYLMSSNITFAYNGVTKAILKFGAVRKVLRKNQKDFHTDAEFDMLYTIYKDKIYDYQKVKFGSTQFLYENEYKRGTRVGAAKEYIDSLNNKEVLYFSVIPTIMDVIHYTTNNPNIPDKKNKEEYDSKIIKSWIASHKSEIAQDNGAVYLYSVKKAQEVKTNNGIDTSPTNVAIQPNLDINFVNPYNLDNIDYLEIPLTSNSKISIKKLPSSVLAAGYYGYSLEKNSSATNLVSKTPFEKGIFDSVVSGKDSFVAQNLINLLSVIDISFKKFNDNLTHDSSGKWIGNDAVARIKYVESTYINNTTLLVSDIAYDILYYNPDLSITSRFYSIEKDNFTDNRLPQIGSTDTRIRYYLPPCFIYFRGAQSTTFVKMVEIDGGPYIFTTSTEPGTLEKIITINKYDSTATKVSQVFPYVATLRAPGVGDQYFFYMRDGLFDLERLLNTKNNNLRNFNSVLWGFRFPSECQELGVTADISGQNVVSKDPHYEGRAIDFDMYYLRSDRGGRINLTTGFFELFNTMLRILKQKHYMNTFIPDAGDPYNSSVILNIPYNTSSWPSSDTYYHLEV